MKIRKISFILLVWGLFLFFGGKVVASGFNLKSIGEVDTSGKQISQWWYSGSTPIFRGEAEVGTVVEIDIDGEKGTAIVDESGNWSYSASTLNEGNHQVLLSSSESNISFTLTTGVDNVNWEAVASGSASEALPAAGIIWPGLIMILTGAGGVIGGGKMIRASKK